MLVVNALTVAASATRAHLRRHARTADGGPDLVHLTLTFLELADPDALLGLAEAPGPLRRLPGRVRRAVQHGRPPLEVVAQLPLSLPQAVTGLLAGEERDLVDEAADGRLGLLLAVRPLPGAFVLDDLPGRSRRRARARSRR